MIERDAAVLVDMDEGSGLIEMGPAEADAHHHRCQRDPAFEDIAGLVEFGDVLPALSGTSR